MNDCAELRIRPQPGKHFHLISAVAHIPSLKKLIFALTFCGSRTDFILNCFIRRCI